MSKWDLRCFKDDMIMETDALIPGYYRCGACGFFAELIDPYEDIILVEAGSMLAGKERFTEEDYEEDPTDGAERPWGHFAPKVKPKATYREISEPQPSGDVVKYFDEKYKVDS